MIFYVHRISIRMNERDLYSAAIIPKFLLAEQLRQAIALFYTDKAKRIAILKRNLFAKKKRKLNL